MENNRLVFDLLLLCLLCFFAGFLMSSWFYIYSLDYYQKICNFEFGRDFDSYTEFLDYKLELEVKRG